jgi:hypothetical protein
VILKTKNATLAVFLAGILPLFALTACGSSDSAEVETERDTETPVDENNYRGDLISAAIEFEIESVDFYLSIGDLTEDLLIDFLENSDDANKGYLAAIKRIRSIDDSTNDFFDFGTELKHLTSDEIEASFSKNDTRLIMELTPLVIDSMELVSEFLQVSRDAATALSIVDKPKWISLQDNLVEIAQKFDETGTARGLLYRSLGEKLEDESLRGLFYELGETF